jgi:hypothetical protein
MNHVTNHDLLQRNDALHCSFGRRIAAALTQRDILQPRRDIDERLRVARDQALARARQARVTAPAPAVTATGGATLAMTGPGGSDTPWWLRLSSLLPLAVLVLGLFLIDHHYTRSQIEAAAEVDAAILADDLPPDAYRDPGFAEFLKVGRR